jgi:hypothetical protein
MKRHSTKAAARPPAALQAVPDGVCQALGRACAGLWTGALDAQQRQPPMRADGEVALREVLRAAGHPPVRL